VAPEKKRVRHLYLTPEGLPSGTEMAPYPIFPLSCYLFIMLNISTALVGKSLLEERDIYLDLLKSNDKDLYTMVLARNINIFTTSYFLTLDDEEEVIDWKDTKSVYRKYYSTRFNALRYLLETYLTTLKLFATDSDNRNNFVYSLALSEKILGHKDDKDILSFDNTNTNFIQTLKNNDTQYGKFNEHYGKISLLVPDSIEEYFIGGGSNPLNNKKFQLTYGFKPEPSGKINYTHVIEQGDTKVKLLEHFETLKNEGIFVQEIQFSILKIMYSLFSKEAHPTFSSIEIFEKYIANQNKESLIKEKIHQNETFLKVLGALMDTLCKTERGASVTELKQSYAKKVKGDKDNKTKIKRDKNNKATNSVS
jgi:hypothetical protein